MRNAAADGSRLLAPMSVPEAFRPPPGNPRFPLVDALRAIAALSILFGHVIFVRQGAVSGVFGGLGAGVTVFFVISGFLLYRPFVAARVEGRPRPRVPVYVRSRLLRIIPALWVALTVVAVYPGLTPPEDHWWAYYTLVQHYIPSARFGGLPQTWSLSVELTFYALLPIYAVLGAALTAAVRRRSVLGAEVALLALVVAARVAFQLRPIEALSTPLTYIDWFAIGMALALASAGAARAGGLGALGRFVGRHPGACWAGAALLYASFAWQPIEQRYTFSVHVLQGIFAGLLVLPAVFSGDGRHLVHRVLSHRALAWLGLVSYGIFLWHVPVITELSRAPLIVDGPLDGVPALAVLSVVATVPLAALSYYLVERPMLRLKR